jgi:hypothetical protein
MSFVDLIDPTRFFPSLIPATRPLLIDTYAVRRSPLNMGAVERNDLRIEELLLASAALTSDAATPRESCMLQGFVVLSQFAYKRNCLGRLVSTRPPGHQATTSSSPYPP